jgi:hypothetical protein
VRAAKIFAAKAESCKKRCSKGGELQKLLQQTGRAAKTGSQMGPKWPEVARTGPVEATSGHSKKEIRGDTFGENKKL